MPWEEGKVSVPTVFIKNTRFDQQNSAYTNYHRSDLHTAKPDYRGKKVPPNKTAEIV